MSKALKINIINKPELDLGFVPFMAYKKAYEQSLGNMAKNQLP